MPPSHSLPALADGLLEEVLTGQSIPGLAVALFAGGELAYERTTGHRLYTGVGPLNRDAAFHVASLSKLVTATTVGRCLDIGLLTGEERVVEVVPEFAPRDPAAASITIDQLLSHRSGLGDYDPFRCWDDPAHDAGALRRFAGTLGQAPLKQPPGAGFAYSNAGYDLLGAAISAARGQAFEDAVSELVLGPLAMSASTFYSRQDDHRHVAWPHGLDASGEIVSSTLYPYHRAHAPSSTLTLTLRDLIAWMAYWLNPSEGAFSLSPARRRHLLDPVVATGRPDGSWMGRGWFRYDHRGHVAVGHGGLDMGYRCGLMLIPERGIGAAVLTNFQWSPVLEVVKGLLDLALGEVPAPIYADEAACQAAVGTYTAPEQGTLTVACEAGRLLLTGDGYESRLLPLNQGTFLWGCSERGAFLRLGGEASLIQRGEVIWTRT